jgi:hypothetical protein
MNWKKLKKIIVPLIILKFLFLTIFIFKSDLISISREITSSDSNYLQGTEIDNMDQGQQKLIRIVRNEEERGIIIKLRAKKNHRLLEDEKSNPVVD